MLDGALRPSRQDGPPPFVRAGRLIVVPVVLVAAALHATWNGLVKPVADRLALIAVMGLAEVAICLPVVIIAAVPRGAAWPELAGSVVLHTIYNLLLIEAYRDGEFNQSYPIARGTAPPTVAVAAVIVVGENLDALQTLGLVAISGGLFLLALGPRAGSRRAISFALLTGLAIAAYTVVDGVGVRRSGTVLGYAGWLFLLNGVTTPLTCVGLRRRAGGSLTAPTRTVARGFLAGSLSLLAYGLVLWAQTRGELAVVAALRETSVVFGALIGAIAFREGMPIRRVLASVLVAAGAAVLAAA